MKTGYFLDENVDLCRPDLVSKWPSDFDDLWGQNFGS